jgi:hypothetical protein
LNFALLLSIIISFNTTINRSVIPSTEKWLEAQTRYEEGALEEENRRQGRGQ